MDRLELARRLFGDGVEGTSTFHPAETQTYIGKAVSDSANGLVRVDIGNSTTEDGEEGIEVATTVSVKEGEEVYVTAVGGTVAKSYYVSGVVGLGDETNSRITAIETDYVKATMLEADLAEIGVLMADSAVITEIQAETAKVENVTAAQLEASTAYIGALQTGNVTAQNIIADKAKLAQIDTSQISADHAVINTLDSNYAKIDLANVSNAWIDDGVIRDAAIGDAQIADISANKLTAGTINGSVINVTNLNATNITTGTINGQRLGEGSISLSKLSESVYTEGEVDSIVSNLNDRIDSAIETYTATAVPTLSNYPASSWDTNDERAEHVGDICYVLNAGSETDGYTYRFAYDNSTGTYQWVLIKDNQVTAALQRLVDAEGDIDGLQSFQSDTSVWISDTDEALNIIRTNHTSLTTVVNKTIVETVQLWYSKANTTAPAKPTSQVTSTSTSGGAWRTVVPSYSTSYPNYFYCYQWKYADGTYGWSSVTRDIAMGEAQSTSRTAASDAASAATTANSNIKSNVQLWYTKQTSTAPSKPSAHVTTNNAGTANAWNLAVPTYNATYPHYFYCYEYQLGNGTYGWTSVVYDSAMTESQERARTAVSDAATAQTTANKNVKTSIQLWYTKDNETAPAKPTAKVTSNSTSGGGWRIVVPSYNASYPKYFYCYQYELADGTYTWSDVVFDRATTENEANAHSALTQLTTKVDISTFNDLTDTVSEHTRNITTLTTTTQQMTQKIDGVASRGEQLVTNGSLIMGNSYNYPSPMEFDGAVSNGTVGSITVKTAGYRVLHMDERFPIDMSKKYRVSMDIKRESGKQAYMYVFVNFYDTDGQVIDYYCWHWVEGSTTTLARDLNPGDTTVYLTDASKFSPSTASPVIRSVMCWDWSNSYGYTYNPETYTRWVSNQNMWATGDAINTSTNTISLSTPWPTGLGSHNAGTYVSQAKGGNTYQYAWSGWVPEEWTTIQYVFDSSFIPPAAASANIGWLWNYNTSSVPSAQQGQIWVTNVSCMEDVATSSQVTTLSNTVNTVSQKADSNLQKISNLTTTLGTNADGTTNVNDIVHRESTLEQDLNSFKSTVSETYATKGALSAETTARTTAIQQTTEAIALKANSSDVYTKSATDGLISTEVTNRNAAIQTATDGIRSEVSETYATKIEAAISDTGSGESVTAESASKLKGLTVHGKSVQNGTPTPSAPVDIMSVRGRNHIVNGEGLVVSGLGSSSGSNAEYRAANLGQSYMDIKHGTRVTISFDLYMTVNRANPTLLVYNTNNKGPKAFSIQPAGTGTSTGVTLSFTSAVGSVIDRRVSVTGYINDRTGATNADNFLEFYSTYGSSNWFSISNLQLEIGAEAHPFAPYDSLAFSRSGKNLLDVSSNPQATQYSSHVVDGDSITVTATQGTSWSYVRWQVPLDGTTATASARSISSTGMLYMQLLDGNDTVLATSQPLYEAGSRTLTNENAASAYVVIYARRTAAGNAGDTATFDGIQLELGSEATGYVPYISTSRTFIPLDGHELRSLSDGAEDTLKVDGEGNVTLTKRMGVQVFDGSVYVPWISGSGTYTRFGITFNGLAACTVMCEQLTERATLNLVAANAYSICGTTDNRLYFSLSQTETTAADAAAALAAHPITVYYKLATPQTISLGTIDMPELQDGDTIWVDAEVTPSVDAEWWTRGGEEVGSVYQRVSSLSQTSEGFTAQFKGVEQQFSEIGTELSGKASKGELAALEGRTVSSTEEWVAWMHAGTDATTHEPYLAMGQSTSGLNSQYTSSKLRFMDGESELASLSGMDGLSAPRVRVDEDLKVGPWAFVKRSNGNLTLKYIGG